MQKTTKISPSSRVHLLCLFVLFSIQSISAQYVFKENSIPKRISIHNQTEFIDVKDKNLTLEEVLNWGKGKVLFTVDVKRGVPYSKIIAAIRRTKSESNNSRINYD